MGLPGGAVPAQASVCLCCCWGKHVCALIAIIVKSLVYIKSFLWIKRIILMANTGTARHYSLKVSATEILEILSCKCNVSVYREVLHMHSIFKFIIFIETTPVAA